MKALTLTPSPPRSQKGSIKELPAVGETDHHGVVCLVQTVH